MLFKSLSPGSLTKVRLSCTARGPPRRATAPRRRARRFEVVLASFISQVYQSHFNKILRHPVLTVWRSYFVAANVKSVGIMSSTITLPACVHQEHGCVVGCIHHWAQDGIDGNKARANGVTLLRVACYQCLFEVASCCWHTLGLM